MTHHWDEFSKSLAEKSVPRRQSLRLLGAALAGALLSPLGVRTAWAAGPDPCKSFCNRYPRSQRSQCLAACRACSGDPSRLCGSGSTVACCASGTTCCSGYCTNPADDFDNCGACGAACAYPGPYEDGACVDGQCFYSCVPGAVDCGDGACTPLWSDPNNCGACGNVCGAGTTCQNSTCQPNNCVPNCPTNWCGGDGCGGTCGCPADSFCMGDGSNMCVPYDGAACPDGLTDCGGYCTDLRFDPYNCGACGYSCDPLGCFNGVCERP